MNAAAAAIAARMNPIATHNFTKSPKVAAVLLFVDRPRLRPFVNLVVVRREVARTARREGDGTAVPGLVGLTGFAGVPTSLRRRSNRCITRSVSAARASMCQVSGSSAADLIRESSVLLN